MAERGKRSRDAAAAKEGAATKKQRGDDDNDEDEGGQPITRPRWKVHQMTQDYVDFSSNFMLTPLQQLGPYGYDPAADQTPLVTLSALDYLTSAKRRKLVVETWSPYEIAVFEAAMSVHGKEFAQIATHIGTKSVPQVIDFYYVWKKTTHYTTWKATYVPPHVESDDDDDEAAADAAQEAEEERKSEEEEEEDWDT